MMPKVTPETANSSARETVAAALGKSISESPSEIKFNKQKQHLEKQLAKVKQRYAEIKIEEKRHLMKLKAKEKLREQERQRLAGVGFLELVEQGKFPRSEFLELISQQAKSKKNRALFGLPSLQDFPAWLEVEVARATTNLKSA